MNLEKRKGGAIVPSKPDFFARLGDLDVSKDFMKLGNPDSSLTPERQVSLIIYLQVCLANPAWVHMRIIFLEALAEGSPYPQGIVFPLSKEQLESVVKFGVLVAYKFYGVTLESLGKLAHSAQGLRDLINVLTSVPESQWSFHWKGALDYPGEVPEIDRDEIRKRIVQEQGEQ